MLITQETLQLWDACKAGSDRFNELFPNGADLQTAMDGLTADGHPEWAEWLFDSAVENDHSPTVTIRGFANAGLRNSGKRNAGNSNSGNCNVGCWNSGHSNVGNGNAGSGNVYSRNTGGNNCGHDNAGSHNRGSWNSGYYNFGDYNSGVRCFGYFNTEASDTFSAFNKPCDRRTWENVSKPDFLYFRLTECVYRDFMTDEEKAEHPEHVTTGGYLRVHDYKDAFRASWEAADPIDRERVRQLPNFDAEVFFAISGIDLR